METGPSIVIVVIAGGVARIRQGPLGHHTPGDRYAYALVAVFLVWAALRFWHPVRPPASED
jgi:hypothetical protein